MKKTFLILLTTLSISSVTADQVVIPDYDTARDKFFYNDLYPTGGTTLYCEATFTSRRGLNVEHVYPASWMKSTAGCSGSSRKQCRAISDRFNLMEADLHNLFPSLAKVNSDRSNYMFEIIGTDDNSENYNHSRAPNGDCDFEIDEDNRTVEPRAGSRGEIARAVFYMEFEYGAPIDSELRALLTQWNQDDPVSADERRRNDTIESIQNTRNPFIDDSTLVGDQTGNIEISEIEQPVCTIKGNISRLGNIYHLPGTRSYSQVVIDTSKGERMFCSTQEAESAGWRAPLQ